MAITLYKKHIIERLNKQYRWTQKTSKDFFDDFVEIIARALIEGNAVSLPGVGVLYCSKRDGYTRFDPDTNEQRQIMPFKMITFRIATGMRDALKENNLEYCPRSQLGNKKKKSTDKTQEGEV